ncbi:hypothetical protein BDA96_04G087600 [Sorghum bicolor]|uniref:DUF6598 domain-containing protein n=1 Tax=Sorghum bicolor TaxID=4558 RepID=A0A921UHT8_SORBI|nr:hypothetical protein BDA96_04G087600 [Sorghum bicolor]
MQGGDGGGEIDRRRPDSTMDDEEMETDVPPSVRKRKMEDQPMEDEPEEEEEEEEEEEVIRACVIEGSKHADGSIYRRDTHFCHRDYWLKDTRETPMKPRIFVDPVTKKIVTEGISLHGCALMQIFSLKLTNHSAIAPAAAGPIMLYGFVAARDLLLPLRNYVFNRTRDDPLVLHRDPDDPSSPLPIKMVSPKRAICLQARAMIEYDLRIKRAATRTCISSTAPPPSASGPRSTGPTRAGSAATMARRWTSPWRSSDTRWKPGYRSA